MADQLKCLKQTTSGQLFAYTPEIAERPDMVPHSGPRPVNRRNDNPRSEGTLAANVQASNEAIDKLLREKQGELDAANESSAIARAQFEDENARLRAKIAELEGGTPAPEPEPVPEVAPAATLAPAEEPAPATTNWPVPENAKVVEHNADPVAATVEHNSEGPPPVDTTTPPVLPPASAELT